MQVDKFSSARATPLRVFQSHLCACKTTQPLPLRRHTHRPQQSLIPAARTPPAADSCRSSPQGQMRRLCRGLLPLQAEIQRSPSRFADTHRPQQSLIPAARTPPAADGCRSSPQGQMRRLCRGLLPLQAEIQATLCNRSRPDSSRDTHRNGARGGPGESHAHLAFPRRLSAAFDARKRPPRSNTHPAATEWKHAPLHQQFHTTKKAASHQVTCCHHYR